MLAYPRSLLHIHKIARLLYGINANYILRHILSCLQHSHYYTRIARFMPRVEIVQKHNTAARRLNIRGHNGKVRPVYSSFLIGYVLS